MWILEARSLALALYVLALTCLIASVRPVFQYTQKIHSQVQVSPSDYCRAV